MNLERYLLVINIDSVATPTIFGQFNVGAAIEKSIWKLVLR